MTAWMATDFRVGHARIGELADLGRHAVELIERQPPRSCPGPAGDDERAVDVEENGEPIVGQVFVP
jgi:hypothetical protein